MEESLEVRASLPPGLRARALRVAAGLAVQQTEYRAARQWSEESLKMAEHLRDKGERAEALLSLGHVAGLGEPAFSATWSTGVAMGLEHAVAYALADPEVCLRTSP